ncbi:MAG: Dabb family protein [Pyrinomonadaceae bacterium]
MLVHVVVWKYKDDISQVKKFEHISKLKALPGAINNILNFEVGNDVIHSERSYDTGLVAAFQDREALDAYAVHAAHQEVAALGSEISEHIASVDFFID